MSCREADRERNREDLPATVRGQAGGCFQMLLMPPYRISQGSTEVPPLLGGYSPALNCTT